MMDRTALQIADQVIATLPEDIAQSGFTSIRESIRFAAPEMEFYHLCRLQDLLNQKIPNPPTEEWHYQAISAFTLQSVDEVKKQFA